MNDVTVETSAQRRARIRASLGVRPEPESVEPRTVVVEETVSKAEPVELEPNEEPSWFERESLRDLAETAVLEAGIDYHDPELQELAGRPGGDPDKYFTSGAWM